MEAPWHNSITCSRLKFFLAYGWKLLPGAAGDRLPDLPSWIVGLIADQARNPDMQSMPFRFGNAVQDSIANLIVLNLDLSNAVRCAPANQVL
jgi:hypothetical protein